MNKFLETQSPPNLNQDEIYNLNRLISKSEIEPAKEEKKISLQTKSRIRWLHRPILTNIQRANHTHPPQTLPKD